MPRSGDRRTLIADTVIAVLAERGSRGLTHRAVDEAAGLPTGSTSYYVRSRADLLACAVPRLAELDGQMLAGLATGDPVRLLTEVVVAGSRGDGRSRTLARYELALEATRRPDLAAELGAGTERVLALVRSVVGDEGPDPAAVLALVDGLLLAQVTGAPWPRPALERAVSRLVQRGGTASESASGPSL